MELTHGQRLVGLDFNQGGDEKVKEIKQIFADAIDAVNGVPAKYANSYMFKDMAIRACVEAQMAAVKYITWKEE